MDSGQFVVVQLPTIVKNPSENTILAEKVQMMLQNEQKLKYKLSENIQVQAEIQPTKLFEQDYLFAAGNKEEKR